MDASFARKVTKNTLFALLARFWSLLIGFLLTPYILHTLGNNEYGIWVLIAAFTSYFGLIDLGLGTSFVKHISEFHARRDPAGINSVLTVGLLMYFVIATLVIALALPMMGAILDFLNTPKSMLAEARFVFALAMVALVINNFTGVYQSVIIGLQRMDVSNIIAMCLSVYYATACLVVLGAGLGLRGLAVNQVISEALGAAASAYWAYRLYPALKFDTRQMRRHLLALLRYGLNLQVSRIAVLVNFQFDKLVASKFINASNVALYDIGSRPAATLRSFPVLLLSALAPATAELEVLRGRAEVYEMFSRASKYVAIVAFPLFSGAIVTAHVFLEAWVGPGYDTSVVIMRILCIGYLLNTLAGPVSPLVQGLGRPDYQRNTELISLVLNVMLSLLLIKQFGLWGAAVGTTLAMSAAAVYYLWSFHHFMERPLLPFLKATFLMPGLCAAGSGLIAYAITTFLTAYAPSGRSGALLILLAGGSASISFCMALIFRSGYLDERDLSLLGPYLAFSRSWLNRLRFWSKLHS